MADRSDTRAGMFFGAMNSIFSSCIEWSLAKFNDLEDSFLCSIVKFTTDEATSKVIMALILLDMLKFVITTLKKFFRHSGRTWRWPFFSGLPGDLLGFSWTNEMLRSVRSQGVSVETFRNVFKHPKKYRFDENSRPVHTMLHRFPKVSKTFQ